MKTAVLKYVTLSIVYDQDLRMHNKQRFGTVDCGEMLLHPCLGQL